MKLDFETDTGFGTEAAMGLIVLQTDETIEKELAQLLVQPGTALYHNRIPMRDDVSAETLAQMEIDLPASASLFPRGLKLDVIGYGCTSASTVIGQDGVAAAINKSCPNTHVTDPISATIAACHALGVKKLGFVTPYVADVSAAMRGLLEQNGLEITGFGSFEEDQDPVVARISPASILAAIDTVAAQGECDAVFVSCTSLRVAGIVEEAEKRIGKPVLSSNIALAWHMRQLAGVQGVLTGAGSLMGISALENAA